MQGRLITWEGIDGSGKSTQIRRLQSYLEEQGISVVFLREPGGTPLGEEIRALLLDPCQSPVAEAELFLFLAARAQLCAQVLKPTLESGTWVLCDRFTDSTLAYQGGGRGMDLAGLQALNHQAVGGVCPDLTILLDIDPEVAAERMQGRGSTDRLDQEQISFYHRVRNTYLQLAEEEPKRIFRVGANRTEEEIFREICTRIESMLRQD